MFQSKDAAEAAFERIRNMPTHSNHLVSPPAPTIVADDFGQKLCLAQYSAMLLEDLNQTKLGHTEFALHEAKTRAGINSRMQTDPVLKQAALNGGPPMLHQMPMMR